MDIKIKDKRLSADIFVSCKIAKVDIYILKEILN